MVETGTETGMGLKAPGGGVGLYMEGMALGSGMGAVGLYMEGMALG